MLLENTILKCPLLTNRWHCIIKYFNSCMFCKQKLYIVIYDKAPFKAGLQHYPTLYIIHGKTSANFFYFFLFEVAFISLIFFSLFAFTPQSTHRTAVIFNELVNCILMNKCNYRKSYTHDEQVFFF